MSLHRGARGVGWALCLVAAAVLALAVGRPLLADRHTAEEQTNLRQELQHSYETSPLTRRGVPVARPAAPGHALARLWIPRFGTQWSWVVVEGTTADDLAKGPGHYTGTPLPGARGNVALAGHRAGHGDPFIDFDRLRSGDTIHLTQGRAWWVYRVVGPPRIVPASAVWVLDPLRGRRLTLTTCWPKYGSSKRMYVRAVLARAGVGSPARQAEARPSA